MSCCFPHKDEPTLSKYNSYTSPGINSNTKSPLKDKKRFNAKGFVEIKSKTNEAEVYPKKENQFEKKNFW